MAYVANMDDEQKKQAAAGGVPPVGGGGVHLAPDSGLGDTAGGAAGTPSTGKAGGSFATLDKYITANQGQAAPLAGKITGSINQEYNTLDQGNQVTNAAIRGQVENSAGYTKGDMGLIGEESAAPVSFAGDANKVQAFQKQLTNSYGGPNSAESTKEFQDQQSKLNQAISTGQAQTKTAAGRNQLIAKNSAKPTAGVTALNSAILSENPEYLGQVESAYKPFGNLVSGLQSSGQEINKTIGATKADAESSKAAANKAISDQITGLNSSVQNKLQGTQRAAKQANDALKANVASGSVSDSDLASLGLDRTKWNALSGAQKAAATSEIVHSGDNKFAANTGTVKLDPTSWLTQQDPNAVYNTANVADAGQYDQANAFKTLLSGLNLNTPQAILNTDQRALAGTAPTNLNSYDYDSALGTANSAEKSTTAAAQAYANALQQGADEEHAQMAAAKVQQAEQGLGLAGYAQTPIAATTAAGAGVVGMGQNLVSQFSTPTNAAKTLGADIASGGLYSTGKAIAGGVNKAVNTVKHIFCFHPLTQVEMASGGTKSICDIQVGEWTKGGMVFATTRGIGTEFYWYEGVLVTGKHAVKEDGKWIRVETSSHAKPFKYLTEVVCNLVTESHRIYVDGIEFADEHETDLYESLDLDESLAEMNKNG